MSFRVKRIGILDKNRRSGLKAKVTRYMPEIVSLKDVPLRERRKEARKPLYLTRYE